MTLRLSGRCLALFRRAALRPGLPVQHSGPLFVRIDLRVDVPAVGPADLSLPPPAEDSARVAARVAAARAIQTERYEAHATLARPSTSQPVRTNADADGELLERIAAPETGGLALLTDAAARLHLSARGYHRVLPRR